MMTRDKYMQEAKVELGEKEYKALCVGIDNDYYRMVEAEIKSGKVISQEVYNSLTEGQKFHFNKHYNYRGDKISN